MKNEIPVFLALGSNVNDRRAYIEKACKLLGKKIHNMKMADLYVTKPWGFKYQDSFLNTVIRGSTLLSPQDLLVFTQLVESEVGRIKRFQNGPREVDIDVLFYGNEILESDTLTIPHPRIQERDFVLRPLVDIDESFIHPKLNMSVRDLFENMKGRRYIIRKY